ncbi:MAG: tRNA lysidine(34) synthetase TilS [Candidatus Omnitrophica bacterium]|nr:tRNA lysidine(34) synthetase TilS [Candidatus Omnitrophota bacterium]
MATNLIEQVLKTIRNYELLKPGDAVLVACSGGPDSVFLLHALVRLKNKLKLKKVAVCNLDHGLRGKESRADSLFVKKMAKELGLEFIHKKVNLKSAGLKGISTEELARAERYKFFKEAGAKLRAGVIATGHTLDDQAETVLMRVIKGASLKGLVGIAPSRNEGDLKVVRPLCELEKSEIVKYLDNERIDYRIDHTNLEPIYFRNIIRGEIIPFLEKFNPRLKRALFSMAEHLREDFEFIEEANAGIKGMVSYSKDGGVEIGLKDLIVQARAIQKEILRDLLEKAGGEVKKLSFRHWKEVEALINRKAKGSSVHLPGGIKAVRGEKTLRFAKI